MGPLRNHQNESRERGRSVETPSRQWNNQILLSVASQRLIREGSAGPLRNRQMAMITPVMLHVATCFLLVGLDRCRGNFDRLIPGSDTSLTS